MLRIHKFLCLNQLQTLKLMFIGCDMSRLKSKVEEAFVIMMVFYRLIEYYSKKKERRFM
jgi:hypothetical protein